MPRFNMKWENTKVMKDILNNPKYRGREIVVFIERNSNIRAKYSNRIHSSSILGTTLMWDTYLKRKGNCWIYNFKKDERVPWEIAFRTIPFSPREHESQSLASPLNSYL